MNMKKLFKVYLNTIELNDISATLIPDWLMSNDYDANFKNTLICTGVYMRWVKRILR